MASSSRRLPRNSPSSINTRAYPTPPNSVSLPTAEECAAKLLVYTKIIFECAEYLRKFPKERDATYQEMEAKHRPNPQIFDKPKQELNTMQERYDRLLAPNNTPDSVRSCLKRMSYAHTATQLYLTTQVFPRSTKDPDFFRRWDAAYTKGNEALMKQKPAPAPYTAPLSKVLPPQSPDNTSTSETAVTGAKLNLQEANAVLKDVRELLSKKFRYKLEEEILDWRVTGFQQNDAKEFQYVVRFPDDQVVMSEALVLEFLCNSHELKCMLRFYPEIPFLTRLLGTSFTVAAVYFISLLCLFLIVYNRTMGLLS